MGSSGRKRAGSSENVEFFRFFLFSVVLGASVSRICK